MNDEEYFLEDDLKTGIKKIRELFSGEIQLIRTILISCLTVIIICILLYFNYILIGQFFTTIFLSFIVSLALKSTKEKIIKKLTNYFTKRKYFIGKSVLIYIIKFIIFIAKLIWKGVIILVNRLRKKELIVSCVSNYTSKKTDTNSSSNNNRLWEISSPNRSSFKSQGSFDHENSNESNYLTIFNNRNFLFFICGLYIVIFKLEFYLTLALFIIYLITDFVIRLLIDMTFSIVKLANKNSSFNHLIFEDRKTTNCKYELNENMHCLISLIMILFFSFIIVIVLISFLWLLYIDVKSILLIVRDNSDYVNYFKTILPDQVKEYYEVDNFDKFYNNNIFVHLKSIELFINRTVEEQFSTGEFSNLKGNHTLYDISNNLINFIKDPSLIIQAATHENNSTNSTVQFPLISILESKCKIYETDAIHRVISITRVAYIEKLYCGIRILIDRFNLEMSISFFSKYFKHGYKIILKIFKLIAGSIFLNLFNFSLELVNSIMLIILFISCLYNFLKMKGDLIKDLLKFLPYPQTQIESIHKSFHNSIQGVFISTFDIFIYHTLLTWLIFDFCNIKFVFLFSIMSGIVTLVPIITPYYFVSRLL
jgi:predicted PurR-regulated permease PerM